MTRTIILLVITYLLNIVDYLQTAYAVSEFGLAVEFNPFARYLFQTDYSALIKLLLPAVLLTLLGIIVKIDRSCMWSVYTAFTLALVVVTNNFIVLFQLGVIERLDIHTLSTLIVVLAAVACALAVACGTLVAICKHLRKNRK